MRKNEKSSESNVLVKFSKNIGTSTLWDKLIKQKLQNKKNIPIIEDLLNSVLISLTVYY